MSSKSIRNWIIKWSRKRDTAVVAKDFLLAKGFLVAKGFVALNPNTNLIRTLSLSLSELLLVFSSSASWLPVFCDGVFSVSWVWSLRRVTFFEDGSWQCFIGGIRIMRQRAASYEL